MPARRIARTEDFGPFVVMQLDDGTMWAYGAPPRGRFWPWAPGPATPDLMAWIAKRQRELAAPSCLSQWR